MSWQFNHLMGQQPTTTGSTLSSTTSVSKSDDEKKIRSRIIETDFKSEQHESKGTKLDNNLEVKTKNKECDSQDSNQQQDNEFFQKLLQRTIGNMNHSQNVQQSQQQNHQRPGVQFNNVSMADNETSASASSSSSMSHQHHKVVSDHSILGHGPTSIIDQLLPDQTSMPWSTYSMPIYSSFGGDINPYSRDGGQGTIISGHNPLSTSSTNHDSGKISSSGSNLVDRFNQLGSDNHTAFSNISSASQASGSKVNQQNDLLGDTKSHFNVLYPHQQDPTAYGRFSIFAQQQPTANNESNPALSVQSSLSTTNQHQLSHFQQPQTSDFILNSHQQPYTQQPSFHLNNNSLAFNHPVSDSHTQATFDGASSIAEYFTRGAMSSYADKNTTGTIGASSNVAHKRRNKLPFFTSTSVGETGDRQHPMKVDMYGSALINSDGSERFSRKVFVGGLPPDIDEEEIKASFRRFGSLIVDWPHKAESKSYFPPKGYAFLLFHEESSVQALIDACLQEEDKLYLCVSSPTIKDKPVQIRPWRLSDADFVLDSTLALDPRKTVFVGGVPRPLKASELANIMNNLYGGVCYAGIDTDPELKYPKGAGRVAFSNHQSYIAAISARFVHLHHSEIEKRVEVKPYVLDDQYCDECQGTRCGNKFAPFFCANITCLKYYCENCWSTIHSQVGREFHKPLVKEGADRPRGVPYKWC